MRKASTLLIANRGEIAGRLIRTARRMGIATVAVHSDADAAAPHVRMADRAVRIGGPAASDSYLNASAIIDAAQQAGANAIHPGYGFLSENADFAEGCAAAGLVFVGPPASAMRAMGDKAKARQMMEMAGVPVVPGYDGADQSAERMAAEAARIGYPVLVKAAAGGGGRGMRRVARPGDFADALAGARREAQAAFGSDAMLIERFVDDARHIEVQIFADAFGDCIHLGERDCSAQRRHQKIVEESPSPFHEPAMCAAMAIDAVAAAKTVGYVGAGTVEFIVGADRRYHFLEMNTRLQVEHPVTEMVTGLDLVEWQLRVAAGERLPLQQDDISFVGHAVEARLCAEDPYAGFRPVAGAVLGWRPGVGPDEAGLRIDSGIDAGGVVTPHYDSMIAKVIAHGRDRPEAIARLRRALLARPLFGIATNRPFLLALLDSGEFTEGRVTTGLVDSWAEAGAAILVRPKPEPFHFALAAAALALPPGADWFRSTGNASCPITLGCEGERRDSVVRFERGVLASVIVDEVDAGVTAVDVHAGRICFLRGGVWSEAQALVAGRDVWIDVDGGTFRFTEPDRLAARRPAADPSRIVSPVSGTLRALQVRAGDIVVAGQAVAMVEAMKMETVLSVSASGTVRALRCAVGDQVRAGDVVVELDVEA